MPSSTIWLQRRSGRNLSRLPMAASETYSATLFIDVHQAAQWQRQESDQEQVWRDGGTPVLAVSCRPIDGGFTKLVLPKKKLPKGAKLYASKKSGRLR
jgi:hypothetical protein